MPQCSSEKSELNSCINFCDMSLYCNWTLLGIFIGNLLTKVIMGNTFSHSKDPANSWKLDILRGWVAAHPKATWTDRDIIAKVQKRGGDEQSDRAERKILMDIWKESVIIFPTNVLWPSLMLLYCRPSERYFLK